MNSDLSKLMNLSDIKNKEIAILFQALDSSVSGIILTDNLQPDNPIIYCNKGFEQITGYKRTEIIGRNCRFLQRADRQQQARKTLKDAVKNEQSCVVILRNYKKDGTLFWNELYMSPVKDEFGKTICFIGVQNDITSRRNAEDELQMQKANMEKIISERTKTLVEKEEYLSSILQTVRESLIVLDYNLTVISVNNFFLKTFKVSQEETVGHTLYSLGNGQWNIPKLKELLEEILPTNNPVEGFEVEHDFPHIGKKVMLLNAYRIELLGSYKDRILLAIEDISEKTDIQKRKDDFLSIASHELKTPLTTLKGYIQLLQQLPVSQPDVKAKFDQYIHKAADHADRINNLINDLLDVSKIQSGRIELEKASFDLGKMIKDSVDNFQAIYKNHPIKLSGITFGTFVGDESRLQQVMANLLSNAIKYSPGSGEIIVYCSRVSEYLKVSVSDAGMGVKLEDHKKIFERFYRVKATEENFPGMGIGLFVCQQIIERHEGSIWVESDPPHGATFSFVLPIESVL